MKRRRATEREVIAVLVAQGASIPCFRCKTLFTAESKPEREHLHELALGGEDNPDNWRYSCQSCHAVITNGTKATSAGSSKHRIAKIKRLTGETCKSRKGPPLKGRGFRKDIRRRMSGVVERR